MLCGFVLLHSHSTLILSPERSSSPTQCIRCYTKYTPNAAAAPFVIIPFQHSQMIFTLGKSQNPPPQAGTVGAAILPQQEG